MNKYQEALNNLKTMGDKDLYNERNTEWCNILQELVDKETPKRIIRYSGMSYDYNEIDFFTCPNCRNLYKGQKYCDECGQALSPEIYDGEIDEDRSDE